MRFSFRAAHCCRLAICDSQMARFVNSYRTNAGDNSESSESSKFSRNFEIYSLTSSNSVMPNFVLQFCCSSIPLSPETTKLETFESKSNLVFSLCTLSNHG